jgi:integrase
VFLWDAGDGALKGFGVRMKPSGAAAYIIQYRFEGATCRYAIGKVGVLATEEARRLARERLQAVAHGENPSAQRREARVAHTVGELCDLYLDAARSGLVQTRFRRPKRASTVAIDEGRVARHIKPLIGSVRANKLGRPAVQRMVDAISRGKTAGVFKARARGKAVVKGGTGTAARVVELLGGIWSWAEKRGFVSGPNPAHGIDTGRGDPRDRILSPEEMTQLGKTLREQEAIQPAATSVVRLIALTGLRREEACGLRWSEIDRSSSCLRLASSKTGRSTRPIGKLAIDLLNSLDASPKEDRPEFVFPNRDGTGSADLKKAVARLYDLAGLPDARSHDLRRSFASLAADEGYSEATIGELLGHARRGVTARHYIRRPDAALVAAADRVSMRIAVLLGESEIAMILPFEDARKAVIPAQAKVEPP